MSKLAGKGAAVTGASKGIGAAIARALRSWLITHRAGQARRSWSRPLSRPAVRRSRCRVMYRRQNKQPMPPSSPGWTHRLSPMSACARPYKARFPGRPGEPPGAGAIYCAVGSRPLWSAN